MEECSKSSTNFSKYLKDLPAQAAARKSGEPHGSHAPTSWLPSKNQICSHGASEICALPAGTATQNMILGAPKCRRAEEDLSRSIGCLRVTKASMVQSRTCGRTRSGKPQPPAEFKGCPSPTSKRDPAPTLDSAECCVHSFRSHLPKSRKYQCAAEQSQVISSFRVVTAPR